MKDVEKILMDGSEKDLREVKAFLMKENFRLASLSRELDRKQKKLDEEKNDFETESKRLNRRLDAERERLAQENRLLEQKLKILQQGYEHLDEDRRRLQREKDKFNSMRNSYGGGYSYSSSHHSQVAELMFSGVNSYLTLKKRYKDLMKIFHPDNMTGDHEMVQIITREYEELKRAYEMGSQAR